MATATLPNTLSSKPLPLQTAMILRRRTVIGLFLLIGIALSFFGFSWDVQWHIDVGPDTFFTLPHLVLYSGVALAGLTCLVAVLWETWQYRTTQSAIIRSTTLSVFGVFRAPLGFLIAGLGSAAFLGYGLFDLWWHSLYGFDVTVSSPPHVGLLTSVQVIMIGAVVVYSNAVVKLSQEKRLDLLSIPLIGLTFAVATSIVMTTYLILSIIPTILVSAAIACGMYIMAAAALYSITRRADILIVGGVITLVLYSMFNAVFIQWATASYATSLSLFIRETAKGYADVPSALPLGVLPMTIVFGLYLGFARKRLQTVKRAVVGGGVLTGALLGMTYAFQFVYLYQLLPASLPIQLIIILLSAVIGGLFARFGWLLGALAYEQVKE